MLTLNQLIQSTLAKHPDAQNPNTREELSWIIQKTFAITKVQLIMQLNDAITNTPAVEETHKLIKRWLTEEPLAYILGETEFMGQLYTCTPPVLIPRPETELLVEVARDCLAEKYGDSPFYLFELGSGTGCIALEMARYFPNAKVYSWDINPKATACANRNKQRHGLSNAQFLPGDYFDGTTQRDALMLDCKYPFSIISNPPYISEDLYNELDASVFKYEDRAALVGESNGVYFYEQLMRYHGRYADYYIFEIGYDQKESVHGLSKQFLNSDFSCIKDMNQKDRVIVLKT